MGGRSARASRTALDAAGLGASRSLRACAMRRSRRSARQASRCARRAWGWRGRDMAAALGRAEDQAPKVTFGGVTVASTVTMRGMIRAGGGTGLRVVRNRLDPSAE